MQLDALNVPECPGTSSTHATVASEHEAMDIRDELCDLIRNGQVTTLSITPSDLPEVSREEMKCREMELRSKLANSAVLAVSARQRELWAEHAECIAYLNSLKNGRGDERGMIYIGKQVVATLERLALIAKTREMLKDYHDRLHSEWEPLCAISQEMRAIVNNRPKPVPDRVQEMTGYEIPMRDDLHDGMSFGNPVDYKQDAAYHASHYMTGTMAAVSGKKFGVPAAQAKPAASKPKPSAPQTRTRPRP